MRTLSVGGWVRMVGVMPNDPDPIPVGAEGTVDWIGPGQYGVKWDFGRTLLLLLPDGPFDVLTT